MKDISDCIFHIYDNGLFAVPLAQALARKAKEVWITTPWETGFSTINTGILGDGFENFKRMDDIWTRKNDVSCFVFPDIQHAGLQLELESQGFPVWGPRLGDQQELNRELFMKTLKRVGLEVPPHVVKVGLDALGEHLLDAEDVYIKISKYRGSFETFHWRSWDLDKSSLALWRVRLGPAGDHLRFLVFDKIDTKLEIGIDTTCVDGRWPSICLHGIEAKDEAYLSAMTPRNKMPQQILDVQEAFSPIFSATRSRMQFSAEVRVLDGVGYFTDPTCRGGLPSTASQIEAWDNLPEMIWAGANGELLEPEVAKDSEGDDVGFTAEAILTIKGDKQIWGETIIPPELVRWIKPCYCCEIDGKLCFPPDESHGNAIGWLVATGSTAKKAVDKINEYADALPDGVTANTESLANVLAEIHEEKKQGIEFSPLEIPEPEVVLENL
jgi:hypothetical protein